MKDVRQAKRAKARATKLALGREIRVLRKQRNWSQEELADRAGVHPTYLAGIERGERNPALENLDAIARAFGLTLSELFCFGDRRHQ